MKSISFVRSHVAVACALAFSASHSFAQSSASNSSNVASEAILKTVVVTASGNEQQLTDTLPHTTVLTAKDIERSQALDLPSLLQREAGVQIVQNGGRGTNSSLFMRGSASLQVLVLLDGVPLTKQDASGSVSLEHLALDQLERIEIVRGNVSAIYGTGAIGGVVQLFTKMGAGKPSGQVQAEIGTRGSYKLNLSAQGSFGQEHVTKLAVGAGYTKTDGISANNTVQLPKANPDQDGYRNTNASLSISQELAKGHSLGLRVNTASGDYNFDNSFGAPTDVQTGSTRVQGFSLFSDNRITSDWRSKLSWSQSGDRSAVHDNGAFGYDSMYISHNRILNWHNSVAVTKDWLLTAGVELQRQSIDTDDGFGTLYAKNRSVNALFMGLQGDVGAHSLQLNMRSDKAQSMARETTGYLGYGYAINPQWKVTASVSNAFNLAPLGYLYDPTFGNPDLRPETARSSELGVQWSQDGSVLRLTAFSTRSKDMFAYDFSTFTFQNVSRSENTGVEISYSGKIAGADVRASLTSQNPLNSDTDQVLRRRARSLAAISWDQPLGAWQLGADVRYSGVRQDGTKRLGGYAVIDTRVRYAFTPELSAYGRIENLSARRYQTAYGYNQPGRGVYVGLQWQPKF